MKEGQLIGFEAIRRFIYGGNAYFTIRSLSTGTRFTYRVSANKAGMVHFVKVLTGEDNEGDYGYIGFVRAREPGRFVHGGAKAKAGREAPSVKAFGWLVRHLAGASEGSERSLQQLSQAEVWHDGRCGSCGRKLTVPESVESGIGPECAKRTGVARKASSDPKPRKAARKRPRSNPVDRLHADGLKEEIEREKRQMDAAAAADADMARMEAEADRDEENSIDALRARFSAPGDVA